MTRKELANKVRRELREGRVIDASRTLMDYRRSGVDPRKVIALSQEVQREMEKRNPKAS